MNYRSLCSYLIPNKHLHRGGQFNTLYTLPTTIYKTHAMKPKTWETFQFVPFFGQEVKRVGEAVYGVGPSPPTSPYSILPHIPVQVTNQTHSTPMVPLTLHINTLSNHQSHDTHRFFSHRPNPPPTIHQPHTTHLSTHSHPQLKHEMDTNPHPPTGDPPTISSYIPTIPHPINTETKKPTSTHVQFSNTGDNNPSLMPPHKHKTTNHKNTTPHTTPTNHTKLRHQTITTRTIHQHPPTVGDGTTQNVANPHVLQRFSVPYTNHTQHTQSPNPKKNSPQTILPLLQPKTNISSTRPNQH
jgi:hypothetical protein